MHHDVDKSMARSEVIKT